MTYDDYIVILLGKPMFGAFADEKMFFAACLLYLAVFYSPGDIFYKVVKIQPIYVIICIIKEVFRAKKIYAGLQVI